MVRPFPLLFAYLNCILTGYARMFEMFGSCAIRRMSHENERQKEGSGFLADYAQRGSSGLNLYSQFGPIIDPIFA